MLQNNTICKVSVMTNSRATSCQYIRLYTNYVEELISEVKGLRDNKIRKMTHYFLEVIGVRFLVHYHDRSTVYTCRMSQYWFCFNL